MTKASPAGLYSSFCLSAACDADLVRRHAKLAWSALGAMLVPTLYALIVLSGVWDPSARTAQLPVALVNQDTGLHYGTRDVNLGAEMLQTLQAQGLFGYREFSDAEDARREVRDGRLAFAVLLPPDFSRQALLGAEPGAGRLILYLSEGNNYAAAGLAKRFAPELAHRVNETLNERRWALALDTATGSQGSLAALRQGVDRLVEGAGSAASAARQARQGSHTLVAGLARARSAGQRLQGATAQLTDGAAHFGDGLRQLGDGLRSIDARAAPERDVQALRQGGRALQRGHTELGVGLQQLQAGSATLRDGAVAFELATHELLFVDERVTQGASALLTGAEQLEHGLDAARGAQRRLADGTQHFVDGSDRLADGLLRQSAAIGQLVARMPDDARTGSFAAGAAEASTGMAMLADGLRQLQDGQARLLAVLVRLDDGGAELSDGLRLLQASLPVETPSAQGTPAGLAHSVQPVLEVVAPVASEGAGFSPNIVPLALWMGAVMTAFLFNYRRLPADLVAAPRIATVAGRLVFPVLVVAGQSLLMLAMLMGMLQVQLQRALPLAVTLLMASLLFLCLIFALVHLFGDVGKMVAVLLLVVQMSAAGALLPIELTAPLFQALHQWLPLTWVVHAFRASLFGAYEGACAEAWAAMLATAVAALACAVVAGRWRPVSAEAYRPAMEVD
jgi:putative membrane protein